MNCIKFCGKFELHLQGHVTSIHVIFWGYWDFAEKLDESLKNKLLSSKFFKGISKTKQNELLDCILEVSRVEIISQIKEAKLILVIADDTTHYRYFGANTTSIVLCYELRGKNFERFWGFFTPSSHDAEILSKWMIKNCTKKRTIEN